VHIGSLDIMDWLWLLLSLTMVERVLATCPGGFTIHSAGTKKYYHVADERSHNMAKNDCRLKGTDNYLAVWETQEEWDKLLSIDGELSHKHTVLTVHILFEGGDVFWTGIKNTGGLSGDNRATAKATLTFVEFPSLDAEPSLNLGAQNFDLVAGEPCMQVRMTGNE